jgi:hypothetical protein
MSGGVIADHRGDLASARRRLWAWGTSIRDDRSAEYGSSWETRARLRSRAGTEISGQWLVLMRVGEWSGTGPLVATVSTRGKVEVRGGRGRHPHRPGPPDQQGADHRAARLRARASRHHCVRRRAQPGVCGGNCSRTRCSPRHRAEPSHRHPSRRWMRRGRRHRRRAGHFGRDPRSNLRPGFTTRDVGQGSGLGLHAARHIVMARQGGSLSASSKPGCTTLRTRLPLQTIGVPS